MASALTSVVVGARAKHTATVVFLHGLGDSGHGWSFLADELGSHFPYIKWILPNAPTRPISLNGGFQMPGWFDVKGLDKSNLKEEDQKGMLASVSSVNQLIGQEVGYGIQTDRIIVGGFSQGGVMALLTGVTSENTFAGIIGCSCWLSMTNKMTSIVTMANKNTPIMMCHGDMDSVVHPRFGQDSANALKKYGYNEVIFKKYLGLAHSANPAEIQDIAQFIKDRLPPIE